MHIRQIEFISRFLPFSFLDFIGGNKVLPLFYHAVGYQDMLPYLKGLYNLPDPKVFESDLDFLLEKYVPIGLEELISYKNTGQLPGNKKYFFLSFDDGLSVIVDYIAPILLRKGIPATFFVNTGFIDNVEFLHRFKTVLLSSEVIKRKSEINLAELEDSFGIPFLNHLDLVDFIKGLRYPQRHLIEEIIHILNFPILEQLMESKPYLSKVELHELVQKGFTIGGHSVSHPEFYLISEEEQLEQACTSIEQINEWFSPKYKVFAFPFTDDGVRESFFNTFNNKCHPDLTFACAGLKKDPINNHIQRISLDDTKLTAKNKLKSEFLYYCLKRPLGRNVMRRK